jgi:hypothetical protein
MLTDTLIMAGASVNGGWSDLQLACLVGHGKPFGKWKRNLRGTYVSIDTYERFLVLANAHLDLGTERQHTH